MSVMYRKPRKVAQHVCVGMMYVCVHSTAAHDKVPGSYGRHAAPRTWGLNFEKKQLFYLRVDLVRSWQGRSRRERYPEIHSLGSGELICVWNLFKFLGLVFLAFSLVFPWFSFGSP